jgi:hypothetical protein
MSGDIWPMLNARGCLGCHRTGATADTVNLGDSVTAYNNLVGHYAHTSPANLTLVTPGSLTFTQSYFYAMLQGQAQTVAFGKSTDNMPPGCATAGTPPCFHSDTLALIALWISQGALR